MVQRGEGSEGSCDTMEMGDVDEADARASLNGRAVKSLALSLWHLHEVPQNSESL